MSVPPISLAVLISGTGRSLQNLIERIEAGRLAARITLVISSSPQARGLEFAQQAGIPTLVVKRSDFSTDEAFGAKVFEAIRAADVKLVVLAGFIKFLPIPADFENRVINIHPALIPAFCGPGFYGQRVHQAVIEQGARVSGCTVHFVDNQYDHGPIILQRVVPVADDDTPETLAVRVFQAEQEALPEAIGLLAAGRVEVFGTAVRVR